MINALEEKKGKQQESKRAVRRGDIEVETPGVGEGQPGQERGELHRQKERHVCRACSGPGLA